MKFTIVFPSHESSDLSLAAVFIPCLVWMEGTAELLTPHPDDPEYRKGDLKRILNESNMRSRIASHTNKVTVVEHSTGHGTQQNLDDLISDLTGEGFEVTAVKQ